MANEKLTAKQILDRAYVDVSIANLEQRKRQIIEETERYLASELPDASDDDFDILNWVLPGFWCKPEFLLFIMDEYQATFCRS
jgi:hypothetical protein